MSPKYLSDIIPSTTRRYSSRNANVPLVRANNNYFTNTFFPSTITEWNKLDLSIRKSSSLNTFKSRLLPFVRPLEDSLFTCRNPIGITYLTRIRLGFSHLRYHKFKHGFLYVIASFTVPNFQLHEIPFSMKSQLLIDSLLIQMKSKLFKIFFVETQPILSTIIN